MTFHRFHAALAALSLIAAVPAPAQTARPMLDYATAAVSDSAASAAWKRWNVICGLS